MIAEIFLFFIGVILLTASSNVLVHSLEVIARFLRLNEFVVAFLMMAFATSSPELFIGITGSLENASELVVGNVIGSNIVNITFILGVVALLSGKINTSSKILQEDIRDMFLVTLLPVVLFLIGGRLSRLDGIILLIGFSIYLYRIYKKGKIDKRRYSDGISRIEAVINSGLFVASVVVMLFSADIVIGNAGYIAKALGMPEILIGLVVIAISTSLPELVFGTTSAVEKHSELSLGDLVGAIVVNSTLVLGISAIISPIPFPGFSFLSSAVFMLFSTFLFFIFAESDGTITWKEGLALLFLYLLFIIVELEARGFVSG